MIKNEAQIIQFEKTVNNLAEVLEKITKKNTDRAIFRDSAIQRFEIAFDVCWKTLKEKLKFEFGIDTISPKKVFQEAFKQGVIENENIWLEATDIRNETSHTYNELFAEEVLTKLPVIYEVFKKLLWKLKR